MRAKMLLGLALFVCGLLMMIGSLGAAMLRYALPTDNFIIAAFAVVLLVIGLIIVLTEVLERWLTRSQTALVDGLQAG